MKGGSRKALRSDNEAISLGELLMHPPRFGTAGILRRSAFSALPKFVIFQRDAIHIGPQVTEQTHLLGALQ